ncbi:response regulator [Clostridium sp. MCC353]|uniref:helix-turn-helix domain-containing protein n=1 Tax=Clostridium sp. MCC353 TaxID=2592646 RepID=UPI001C033287|nr:helix-turn-helix domain-containing protein [Clostridium sp. MCC353]MBT9775321.1 response regulator [Clostridium sp. MCC353]
MDTGQMIRIVIADDESSIRNGLNTAVPWESLNMSVIGAAKDGMEAWELIRAYQPAIAVTDIRMPRLSGLDLIKKCHEANIPTKFIILSGFDDFSYAQTAIRYGARAYILKPLKIEELTAELEGLRDEILEQRANGSMPDMTDYQSLRTSSKKLFLNQLVQNEFRHNSDILKKLQELHLPLTDSPYRILVFSIQQTGEPSIPDITSELLEIVNEEAGASRFTAWECNPSQVILLVHTDGKAEPAPVRELAKRCLKQFKALENYRIVVGIGSGEQELINAYRSYGTALTALSYQIYEKEQDIYDESVICGLAPTISTSSIDISELISAIRRNDAEQVKAYCRSYFNSLLYVPMPPPSFIRGMCIYLITDVQNTLRKQIQSDINLFTELPYVTINQMSTLRQIEEWTTGLFSQYADLISQYLQDRKDSIILDAKQFIQDNVDKKIQAEDVAAHVNLSTSYFTIYFKAKTGTNFRDYVLNVKMEQAKHLLESGQANISEISYAVGYDDYRSFYRAFKNHTGMTPSEYQAKH